MSWLATVFFLAASMFLIPFGRLADILGVKRIFSTGIGIYFISALLAALAPSAPVLIVARFTTGLGAAMIFGTSFALLSLSLSERERGAALGINIASNITGFALGFFLGGIFTYYLNWRFIFLSTLPISLIVLGLIRFRLPGECALSKGERFDLIGSALIAVQLFLLIRGLTEIPSLRGGPLYPGWNSSIIALHIAPVQSHLSCDRHGPLPKKSLFLPLQCRHYDIYHIQPGCCLPVQPLSSIHQRAGCHVGRTYSPRFHTHHCRPDRLCGPPLRPDESPFTGFDRGHNISSRPIDHDIYLLRYSHSAGIDGDDLDLCGRGILLPAIDEDYFRIDIKGPIRYGVQPGRDHAAHW